MFCSFACIPIHMLMHVKYVLMWFICLDGWNKFSHPYTQKDFGKWQLHLPPKEDNTPAVAHGSKLKVCNAA